MKFVTLKKGMTHNAPSYIIDWMTLHHFEKCSLYCDKKKYNPIRLNIGSNAFALPSFACLSNYFTFIS